MYTNYQSFRDPGLRFEISMRSFQGATQGIMAYIARRYPFLDTSQIRRVYGFHEQFSRLYGGRSFEPGHVITDADLDALHANDIHYYLPLTNHYVTRESYEASRDWLEKMHRPGNTVVCYSDELASWLRQDYPLFGRVASVIKNLNDPERIARALDLYDMVVVPPQLNHQLDVLASLQEKQRLILFGNNTCRHTCSAWVCYKAISKGIRDVQDPYAPEGSVVAKSGLACSRMQEPKEDKSYMVFDLDPFRDMGFRNFKLIPPVGEGHGFSREQGFKRAEDWPVKFRSPRFVQVVQAATPSQQALYRQLEDLLTRFDTPQRLGDAARAENGQEDWDLFVALAGLAEVGLIEPVEEAVLVS